MAHLPLIRIKNVTKTFKTAGGDVRVLKDINLLIPEGSFTIIYGASGSGKSTLLNILMGLEQPTTGMVTYESKDMYAMSVNERAHFRAHTMGMVQQSNQWVKSLTVLENVALPLHFIGISPELARKRAREALKDVGVDGHSHKMPSVLSGGEQQRVAIARALVNKPAYIVADEPTGNLDSHNGDAMINLLRTLHKDSGRTVVLVTHNIEYLPIGDQLLFMEDGILTQVKNTGNNITNQLLADLRHRIQEWAKV